MNTIFEPMDGAASFLTGPLVNITGPGNAVANTTTQTSLFTGATFRNVPGLTTQSLTIPANSLMAGDMIDIDLWGVVSAADAVELTIKVLLGSTVVLASNAVGFTTSVTSNEFYPSVPIRIRFPSVGSSGTCAGHGQIQAVMSASGNNLAAIVLYNAGGTSGPAGTGALTAIDTTVAQTLDVQVSWSAAAAGNTIQLLGGCITKTGV
jgi:hypothetical protein